MKSTITIEIDTDLLQGYTDQYLAQLWHVGQANPADGFASPEPGEIAARIGYEIIRRWLHRAGAELYHHQPGHHAWHLLTTHGSRDANGAWRPNPTPETTQS